MAPSNVVIPFNYRAPDPFTVPTTEARKTVVFTGSLEFLNDQLPPKFFPREALHIDAVTLEEIMANISDENNSRGRTKIQWRTYKASGANWTTDTTFDNPKKDGSNLIGQSLEVFALIVDQIQTEIETLVADADFPDDLGRLFGRILANNTTIGKGKRFNDVTKLPSSFILDTKAGKQTIDPLAEAQSGDWPFDAELIGKMVPVLGVRTTDPDVQQVNISTIGGSNSKIQVTDPNFPQSPYGDDAAGVPGVDVDMTAANRTVFNRINTTGIGAGREDPDMGYGFYAGHALMIEQLRYQPPQVETFPFTKAVIDYASNLFSTTTPNLPWVLSLPVETQIVQNWGLWLIKGNVGVTAGGAFLRAYNNPSAQAGAATQCPFAVFFPPAEVNCSCFTADEAYFLWVSNEQPLVWNDLFLTQIGRGIPKSFGRNTRMKVDVELTGQSSPGAEFRVGVRTSRISNVQSQPFLSIISTKAGTGLDVNIMDRLSELTLYTPGGTDALLAIQISVSTQDSASATCATEAGPFGQFVPESCLNIVSCSAGDFRATVKRLRIEDPALVGDPVSAYQ